MRTHNPVAQYDQNSNGLTGSAAIVGGSVYRGSAIPQLKGQYFFADFSNNPGPFFAVHVSDLVERDDFSNIASFDDGRLAPFVEVRIRDGGADKTFRQFLRDANANPGLNRTDTRWGVGPDGELYVLNKHDGRVRRIAGVVDFPDPEVPALPGWGLLIPAVLLGGAGFEVPAVADTARAIPRRRPAKAFAAILDQSSHSPRWSPCER